MVDICTSSDTVMRMPGTRVTYSGFLRGPSDVLPRVAVGDVVLERRDGENLLLSTEDRTVAFREGLDFGATALRQIAREHPGVLADTLRESLPWLGWLPDEDRTACIRELLDDLAASAAVENFTRFHADLVAWRSTAEVWADPALAERLQADFEGDVGEVKRPEAVA